MPQNESQHARSGVGTLATMPIKAPLGPSTKFGEVNARVAVRLVQIDFNKHPERYLFKYRGVDGLAEALRYDKMCPYTGYFYLISLAKYLLAGGTMASWIIWASTQSPDTIRAIHKRPFRAPRVR